MQRKVTCLLIMVAMIFMISPSVDASNDPVPLSSLEKYTVVYDPSWEWEYRTGEGYTGTGPIKPVKWVVVEQNGDNTILMTKDVIALYPFGSSDNNKWDGSHIKRFLNEDFFNVFSVQFQNNTKITMLDEIYVIGKVVIPFSGEIYRFFGTSFGGRTRAFFNGYYTVYWTRTTVSGGFLTTNQSKFFPSPDTQGVGARPFVTFDSSVMVYEDNPLSWGLVLYSEEFGDITGDGKTDVADVIKVLRYIVGLGDLNDEEKSRATVSGQSSPSVSDVIIILKYIVGLYEPDIS